MKIACVIYGIMVVFMHIIKLTCVLQLRYAHSLESE